MKPLSLFEAVGIAGGVGFAILMNVAQRKPMPTGIYKHVGFGLVGYFAGQKLESFNNEKLRERVLVLEDYVRRHPEDFPEEAPKKYGDVLLKWYPVR